LTLLSSLLIASNTVCGIDEVLGGLRGALAPMPFAAVALGSFSVAVDVFVAAGFFAVVFFATGFFAVGFFVIFAIFFSLLKGFVSVCYTNVIYIFS
jgi:hypothetical protein